MHTIFSQMLAAVRSNEDVLTEYQEDILVDVETLKGAKPGDQLIWILRANGTHLVIVGKPGSSAGIHSIRDAFGGEGLLFYHVAILTNDKGFHPVGVMTKVSWSTASEIVMAQDPARVSEPANV